MVHFKGGWGRVGGRRGVGGQDGEVTASHSSLRFRCCAAEFPRVTRLTAGGGNSGGVGVEVWRCGGVGVGWAAD